MKDVNETVGFCAIALCMVISCFFGEWYFTCKNIPNQTIECWKATHDTRCWFPNEVSHDPRH